MNQFDRFIEETEQKFNIDTSSRKTSINLIHRTEKCKRSNSNNSMKPINNNYSICSTVTTQSEPRDSVILNSEGSSISNSSGNSTKSILVQKPLTPVRINNLCDQPLNNNESEKYIRYSIAQDTVDTNTLQPGNQNDHGLRVVSSSKSVISKRRSLIQPIIVHNDDNHKKNISGGSIDINQNSLKNIERAVANENLTLSSTDFNITNNCIENSNIFSSLVDNNNVDDLLKNLANKELELLESKRNIEELKRKLLHHEKLYEQQYDDLKKLKAEVSRHISDNSMMNIDSSNISTKKGSPVRREIIQFTPEKLSPVIKKQPDDININKAEPSISPLAVKKRNGTKINIQRDTTRKNLSDMTKHSHTAVIKLNPVDYNPPKKSQNRNESMWSKPFALFNQFDQLLQTELEKSLNWDNGTENASSFIEETDKEESSEIVRSDLDTKNTGYKSNPNDYLHKQSAIDSRQLQSSGQSLTRSVSTSLWGFVNDVKEGLLGTYELVDDDKSSSQDTTNMKEFNTTRKNDQVNRSVEMAYI
ncbi:Tda11p PWA37_002373 [Arxiozyma heterogenica]|uniref:Tda11p n=1 Tax=Arxiozyma heterogenica TaxID=278026 RepID=UPI002F0781CE